MKTYPLNGSEARKGGSTYIFMVMVLILSSSVPATEKSSATNGWKAANQID